MKGSSKASNQATNDNILFKRITDVIQGKTLSLDEKLQMIMYFYYLLFDEYSESNQTIENGTSNEVHEKMFNLQIQQLKVLKAQLLDDSNHSILISICNLYNGYLKSVNTLCTCLKAIVYY